MDHYYQNIYGWFDYEDLFTEVINLLPQNSHIVEIGAYKGRSTAYLAVEAINSGKNIKIDVIDTWDGVDGSGRQPWSDYIDEPEKGIKKPNGDIFEEFKTNLLPVWNSITPIKLLSLDAVNLYKDESLDFVFIDGNHNYSYVKEDILKWKPKIKKGGILSGHDYYNWIGVKQAVDEIFGINNIKIMSSSWLIKL